MPYEAISAQEYKERIRDLKPVNWNHRSDGATSSSEEGQSSHKKKEAEEEEDEIPANLQFCDGDKCVLLD
jgi:hypothetical protein